MPIESIPWDSITSQHLTKTLGTSTSSLIICSPRPTPNVGCELDFSVMTGPSSTRGEREGREIIIYGADGSSQLKCMDPKGTSRTGISSAEGPSRRGPRWPDICQLRAYCDMNVLKSSLLSIDSTIDFNPGPIDRNCPVSIASVYQH